MKKALQLFTLVLVLTATLTTTLPRSASAVTAANWKPGRIIDDSIFTNGNDMTVAQIQSFLNSKVPECDSDGSEPSEFGGGTRAQWAIARGYPGRFTCLRDYYEVPKTEPGNYIPANNYGGKAIPAGAISAAQMIYNAAQKYQINPKVLLVTIHKESSGPLTTDEWPLEKQYTYAMGAHCPDSGPGGSANCDVNYSGFSMQIAESAALMRWYLDSMTQGWWQYKKPYQTNYVLWNVSQTGCGGSNVYIENKATAALYTYTPYQPNQAALNNMYGTGDGCSAYGNRNFWRIYSDWFGTTLAPNYSWQWAGQNMFTDDTMSTSVDSYTTPLERNTRYYLYLRAKNTGNVTWQKDKVRLGTSNVIDRKSAVYDPAWINQIRAATFEESSVQPGEYATFKFWIQTPQGGIDTKEYFNILWEGVSWMNDPGVHWVVKVPSPIYSWQWAGQNVFTDETMSKDVDTYANNLEPNKRYYFYMRAKNTGNITWEKDKVRLATVSPANRSSRIADETWLSSSRPATFIEDKVKPGEFATFKFWTRMPLDKLDSKEYFSLVWENVSWMNNPGVHWVIKTPNPVYSWQWAGQNLYTDATMTASIDSYTTRLKTNTRYYLYLRAKNTGNVTWQKNQLRLGTTWPGDRYSKVYDPAWLNQIRPATLQQDSVAPGEYGTFYFWIKTSAEIVSSKEYFNPLWEGVSWLNDPGVHWVINTEN